MFLENFEARLGEAQETIQAFGSELSNVGIPVLERELNVNITNLDVRMNLFRESSREMFTLLEAVLKDLACQRIYDIYYQVVHEATCDSTYKGLLWTFSSFLVMSFCGCMMIMFRAVLYPLVGVDDDFSWNEVKEQEMNEGVEAPDGAVPTNYVADEGLNKKGGGEANEAPMGGQAQQRYDAVGDENPFQDGNDETFAPKKSSWQ